MPQLEDDVTVPSWLSFFLKTGISAGLAVYFAYTLTTSIAGELHQTRDLLLTHTQTSAQAAQLMQLSLDRIEREHVIMIDLIRTSCVNQADDYLKRQACLAVGTR
jgi:hypothetical protein